MSIEIIAGSLLLLRIISTFFLILVLKRQLFLIRQTDTDLDATRKLLFSLVLITVLGNVIPILIDASTLVEPSTRANPSGLGVLYAYSNAMTAAISALGWWFLYKLIQQEGTQMRKDNKQLAKDNVAQERVNKVQKQENVDLTAENKELRKDK